MPNKLKIKYFVSQILVVILFFVFAIFMIFPFALGSGSSMDQDVTSYLLIGWTVSAPIFIALTTYIFNWSERLTKIKEAYDKVRETEENKYIDRILDGKERRGGVI